MDRHFTTKETAELLDVTPGRVRQMVVDGILTPQKFGRDLMFSAKDIEAARKRKTTPGPAKKKVIKKR